MHKDTTKEKVARRQRIYFDIDARLRRNVKAAAALRGMTMREWCTQAVIRLLEDEIDAKDVDEAMKDLDKAVPWEVVKAELGAKARKHAI